MWSLDVSSFAISMWNLHRGENLPMRVKKQRSDIRLMDVQTPYIQSHSLARSPKCGNAFRVRYSRRSEPKIRLAAGWAFVNMLAQIGWYQAMCDDGG